MPNLIKPPHINFSESLGSFGYTFSNAIADLIDNSISAKASKININSYWDGSKSYITLNDNGFGMTKTELENAMEIGSKSPNATRKSNELGRFGLGLKTASFSQCNKLTVISKTKNSSINGYTWDLNHLQKTQTWELLETVLEEYSNQLPFFHDNSNGTIVIWEQLKFIEKDTDTTNNYHKSNFLKIFTNLIENLKIIFHKFLDPTFERHIKIYLNQNLLPSWSPFNSSHVMIYANMESLRNDQSFKIRSYVIKHKDLINDEKEYEEISGPFGLDKHSGFYIYRNDRLIDYGNWLDLELKINDRHNHARLELYIPNNHDLSWSLDVKKSKIIVPASFRSTLKTYAKKVMKESENIKLKLRSQISHDKKNTKRIPVERFWQKKKINHKLHLELNHNNPIIQNLIQKFPSKYHSNLNNFLKFISQSIPFYDIQGANEPIIPTNDLDPTFLSYLTELIYTELSKSYEDVETINKIILNTSPYNQHSTLVNQFLEELNK